VIMASSSVSQEDHDVEHEYAMASRRQKVRSARANRAVNSYANQSNRGSYILALALRINPIFCKLFFGIVSTWKNNTLVCLV